MSRSIHLALGLALCLTPTLAAQTSTHRLGGPEAAIYNLVGEVTVRGGTGPDVIIEVSRAGTDASRLTVETTPLRGIPALRVLYPEADIVYPALGRRSRTTLSVGADGSWGGSDRRRGRDRRVTVQGEGEGLEAHADLTVTIPKGRKVSIYLGVGAIEASNVDGTILLDAASADVRVSGSEGMLGIDTGSGDIEVRGASGVLDLDTGSGSARLERSKGSRLEVETGSGDVHGEDLDFRTADIETGSGAITITNLTGPSVTLETGSGDVAVELTTAPERLDVETGSGNVNIQVPEAVNATIELSTGSGDFRVDFPLQIVRKDEGNLTGRAGDGQGRITIETGSGDITLAH